MYRNKSCTITIEKQSTYLGLSINRTLFVALLLRLLMLAMIYNLSSTLPSMGFFGDTSLHDDFRYIKGAEIYSQTADKIIDTDAFARAYALLGDGTGYSNSIFDSTPLWYWTCCIIVYFTKTTLSIRIVNIFFAVLSIKYVCKIVLQIYGRDSALTACKILTYMPYFVIFSCFTYKDTFVSLCTFYIMSWAVYYKKNKKVKFRNKILTVFLTSLALLLTRGGLSVLFLVIMGVYLYSDFIVSRGISKKKLLLAVPLLIICSIMLINFWDVILYKFEWYVGDRSIDNTIGVGKIVKISRIVDIWKLPLAFLFSVINPIDIYFKVKTWYEVVCNLNFTLVPISIGAFMYIVFLKKRDLSLFIMCACYYSITIISSVLIFRQVYSLLPIPVMWCSAFINNSTHKQKKIFYICVFLALMVLSMFFLWG